MSCINTTRGKGPGYGCHGKYGPLSRASSPFLPLLSPFCSTALYYSSNRLPLSFISTISPASSFPSSTFFFSSLFSPSLPSLPPVLSFTPQWPSLRAPDRPRTLRRTRRPSMHHGRLTGADAAPCHSQDPKITTSTCVETSYKCCAVS